MIWCAGSLTHSIKFLMAHCFLSTCQGWRVTEEGEVTGQQVKKVRRTESSWFKSHPCSAIQLIRESWFPWMAHDRRSLPLKVQIQAPQRSGDGQFQQESLDPFTPPLITQHSTALNRLGAHGFLSLKQQHKQIQRRLIQQEHMSHQKLALPRGGIALSTMQGETTRRLRRVFRLMWREVYSGKQTADLFHQPAGGVHQTMHTAVFQHGGDFMLCGKELW